MLQLTIMTWMLIIFEAITFLPLLGAQLVILLKPHGQKAKDILIGIGKKIWNLDNVIWTLQGRHRDMVHFADFIYNKPLYQQNTLRDAFVAAITLNIFHKYCMLIYV
jgi:alpha-L-arabinofuranosidase